MLVSVAISNYNYAHFLPQCLDSVLKQTWPDLEIIVVDDGSTDDSRAVLERYAPRVRSIFQENAGQAAAMTRAFAESTGELVCLLDCDDVWAPNKVQRMVEVVRAHPEVGWVRHKARMVDERFQLLEGTIPSFRGSGIVPPDPALFTERIVNSQPSCLALTREVAEQVFPLVITPDLAFDADDAVLLARVFATGRPGYSLDEILGYYRRHLGARFGAHDIPKLLRREADVTEALPRVFGRTSVPSAGHKLRAVLAAMDGARPWEARRAGPFARGLAAAMKLWRRPKLMMRQAAAVSFAFAAPQAWLRKLARSQQWPSVE